MPDSSRCSATCDGPGPDVADRGPNPEDAVEIPCPVCGRRGEISPAPGARHVVAALTKSEVESRHLAQEGTNR